MFAEWLDERNLHDKDISVIYQILDHFKSLLSNKCVCSLQICRLNSFRSNMCWYTGSTGVKFSPTTAEIRGLIPVCGPSGRLPMSTTVCVLQWEASEGVCPCRFTSHFLCLVRAPAQWWVVELGGYCVPTTCEASQWSSLLATAGDTMCHRSSTTVCSSPWTVTRSASAQGFGHY